MSASTSGSLTTTGSVVLAKPPQDTLAKIQISGTYGGVTFVVEGSEDGSNYGGLQVIRDDTGATVNGGTNIAPTDSSTLTVSVPNVALLSNLRARVTSGGMSGTAAFTLASGAFNAAPVSLQTVNQTVGAVTTATIDAPSGSQVSIGTSTAAGVTLGKAGNQNTINGLIAEGAADALTAVGTTQGGALALSKELNRVTTAANATAPFNGVTLPASVAGLDIIVINTSTNPIQVYGLGADQVNAQTSTVGITQPPNSVFFYACTVAGNWQAEGVGGGYSGSLATFYTVGGISAAGSNQGTATALAAVVNRVTTCAGNAGVILPANAVGLSVTVTNDGANACNVYPDAGAAINSLATNAATPLPVGASATFTCVAANVWKTVVAAPRAVSGTLTTVGAGTILAATIVGGEVTRTLIGSAATDTTDTAANIIAALHGAAIGQSWEFTYVNNTAFAVTLANGASVTVSELAGGTLTVTPNSWARFLVTVASATTVTMQCLAQGPNQALPPAKFTSINVTTGTLAAGNASGAAFVSLTSTNATPGSQAMRTVAQVLTDTPGLAVGTSYVLRITQTGAGTLTLATDGSAQFTMTGTMTVPQNTTRDFIVTINSATTGTVQAVGTGTFS